MSKKRRAGKTNKRPRNKADGRNHLSYRITDQPLDNADFDKAPQRVKEASERLHTLSQTRPREAIPELAALIEEYPHIPMWYNFLFAAYALSGDVEKSREIAMLNYQRNPDYLFARINYAEICLKHRDYDKVAEIFDHKFDLRLLYPERKCFHVSEFAGFMGLIGVYFVLTGRPEAAEKICTPLSQVAPDSPLTLRLQRMLNPMSLRHILKRPMSRT
jgi:hypothetical protein